MLIMYLCHVIDALVGGSSVQEEDARLHGRRIDYPSFYYFYGVQGVWITLRLHLTMQ